MCFCEDQTQVEGAWGDRCKVVERFLPVGASGGAKGEFGAGR